ncbi:MAG: hypothetical protein AAGF12_00575 [Myxococcota bacterium]
MRFVALLLVSFLAGGCGSLLSPRRPMARAVVVAPQPPPVVVMPTPVYTTQVIPRSHGPLVHRTVAPTYVGTTATISTPGLAVSGTVAPGVYHGVAQIQQGSEVVQVPFQIQVPTATP